jgi:ubiquinone/menaquinone biosynthesis C-methylase UbiE
MAGSWTDLRGQHAVVRVIRPDLRHGRGAFVRPSYPHPRMTTPYDRSARWYDRIYGDKAYRDEADALRALVEAERPGARTLLEVGCGTGGHLVFLREHLECVGVDLSASMLAQAREKLPDLPFHQADMRAFDLHERFDVVASLFSAIGYVRSTDELFAAVACMARHLQPGGVLVIEPWFSPEQWNPGRIHGGMIVDEPDLKIVRMVVSEQRDRFAVTPMHHLVATLEGVEHVLETHQLFLAQPEEYRAALQAAGLEAIRFVPDVLVRGLWIGRAPA